MTAILSDLVPLAPVPREVIVRQAPRREPPFDDEREVIHQGNVSSLDARRSRYEIGGLLARAQPLPFDPPTQTPRHHTWAGARLAGRGQLPDPESWARRLLVALLEARAGQRSVRQLTSHLSPSVLAGLEADLARTADQPPTGPRRVAAVRSVRVCEPADGVAEIAAVIQLGARFRAVAVRLEGCQGQWRCVRLQFG